MKILNIICDSSDDSLMPKAVERLKKNGFDIDAKQYVTSVIDGNEMLFSEITKTLNNDTLVLVRVHAGLAYFKKFDRLKEMISERGSSLFVFSEMKEDMSENRRLFVGTDEDYLTILKYLSLGGERNEYGLLSWLLKKYDGCNINVERPYANSAQGLYLPGRGEVDAIEIKSPAVAVMFGQSDLISGRTAHVDALVKEMEARDICVIPVFFTSYPNDITGSIGVNGTIRKYLISEGRPLVDAVILAVPFSQINLSDPKVGEKKNIFAELNVPIIQTAVLLGDRKSWESNPSGLGPFELSMSIYWPEYDGQIIGVPIASVEKNEKGQQHLEPIRDRIRAVADLAANWSRLRNKPIKDRKIAIVLYQNPPRSDMVGSAFGLDAAESTVGLLRSMKKKGYMIGCSPLEGKGFVKRLLDGATNDTDWLSAEDMRTKAAATITKRQYIEWLDEINDRESEKMLDDWGEPPGTVNAVDDVMIVPGFVEDNVFIGLQPNRGLGSEDVDVYHSQDLSPPHSYLAFYRWITRVFRADAIIHMGCHGTLEWLPGKGTGLSSDCYPDIVMDHVPHIYSYAINNPGEGVHAKRRNGAVIIDHLTPTLMTSGGYDDLLDIESKIQEYLRADAGGLMDKKERISSDIMELCEKTNILGDLWSEKINNPCELEGRLDRLYDYISEIKSNMIKNGLHILGEAPKGEELDQTIYSLVRIGNGKMPSLPQTIAKSMGYDYSELSRSPSTFDTKTGKTFGMLIDDIERTSMNLLKNLRKTDYNPEASALIAREIVGDDSLDEVIREICTHHVPKIEETESEINNVISALDGTFIMPGPSGCPSRGNAHLLPTGRNFYSIDPASIPSESSWATGVIMADQMIERHVKEHGCYPKQVGIVIWATDTMKTGGDDIAYILHLLGLRPKWSSRGGTVVGMEVVNVTELGRPRIDVTLRISGLFRDSFPNLVMMIDDAVDTISKLDESDEDNYLLKHLRSDISESIADGIDPIVAAKKAKVRIFGDPPGNYGAGVDSLIGNSSWGSKNDLANAYVEWGGYAYGRGFSGEDLKDFFRKRMSEVNVTVKNHESRELDALDNDDDYIFLGGMNAAVESCSGSKPMSIIGDSSDPSRPKTRTLEEESKFIYRSRVLNPKWIQGLKKHGYRGVQELSNLVDFSFGWDSTSDIMEDWMYQTITDNFILDKDNRQWIEENNPDALRHITSRLLEAVERKMWNADEKTIKSLEEIFVSNENALEGRTDH